MRDTPPRYRRDVPDPKSLARHEGGICPCCEPDLYAEGLHIDLPFGRGGGARHRKESKR